MNSETPKDSTSSSHHHAVQAKDVSDSETPGSHGLEMLEPLDADFDDGDGYDANNNDNDGNFLAPHERKLPLSEQRQLLAMRRRPDDDNDIEEADIRSGRRYWHMHNQEHGIGRDGISGATSATGAAKDTPAAEPAATAAGGPPGSAVPGETAALLNDPAHPNKPLYDAVLQGVGTLDASKVPLTETEQANVAGALTASMTQTPGFQRGNPDPTAISIAASENGDRVFAINSQNPGAPNAMYTSVEVEQVRSQSLQVSSAQVAPPSSAPEPPTTIQEQVLSPESQSPRVIA
ncbi:MAG: XVIPCD domain-containing protein [Lysobacteraceae bacterium]